MSVSHNPPRWQRVSRAEPCPICDHPDWCSISTHGRLAWCERQLTATGGHVHHLDISTGAHARSPIRLQAAGSTAEADPAPIDRRDRVSRGLAAELGLTAEHRRHLVEVRGLPPAVVDAGGFATVPPALSLHRRCELAGRVAAQAGGGPAVLRGVPGFYESPAGWALVPLPAAAGFLVPVPDGAGRLQGYQIRRDHPGPDQPRYVWLSSRGWPGGASPGVPVAAWQPELAAAGHVWVTEGSLKAAIAAHWLPPGGACVLAVPGVACWRQVPATLADLLATGGRVVLAYDADLATNPLVHRHRDELAMALMQAGYAVWTAQWDSARAKGLDDAVLAGVPIAVEVWRRRLPPLVRPVGVRLPPLVRPRGVPLPPLVRPVGVPLAALLAAARVGVPA